MSIGHRYRKQSSIRAIVCAAAILFFAIGAACAERPLSHGFHEKPTQLSEYIPSQRQDRIVPLHEVPEFRPAEGQHSSHQTNGLVAGGVRDIISGLINDQYQETINTPGMRFTFERQRVSAEIMGRIAAAAPYDPAMRAFELSDAGMDAFLDSISVIFVTQNLDIEGNNLARNRGSFDHDSRFIFTALNTLRNGSIQTIDEDSVVHTFLYEIFGRGFGYGVTLSRFAAEHLGVPMHSGIESSIWSLNPAFEWALASASGGVHEVLAAANRGQDNFRQFSNETIPLMNPLFNFDYDTYRRAGEVTLLILTNQNFGEALDEAVGTKSLIEREIWIIKAGTHFQAATDPNTSHQERQEAAIVFIGIVAILDEIAIEYNIVPAPSVNDRFIPRFNLDMPQHGIISMQT